MIYIDGVYSHSVRKIPKRGDYRSQEEYGSHITREEPTQEEFQTAEEIMAKVEGETLYGRVDLMGDLAGHPRLVELELTEPCLYLEHSEESVDRLTEAILKRLG